MGILKTIIPLPSLSNHSSLSALGILLEITVHYHNFFKIQDMLSFIQWDTYQLCHIILLHTFGI